MARIVTVKCLNIEPEELVTYPVGIPDDVIFYEKDGIMYAQWWDISSPPNLITVPARQLVSIQ